MDFFIATSTEISTMSPSTASKKSVSTTSVSVESEASIGSLRDVSEGTGEGDYTIPEQSIGEEVCLIFICYCTHYFSLKGQFVLHY